MKQICIIGTTFATPSESKMKHFMYNICNMLKHKGEIIEKIINSSDVPVTEIAKRLGMSRATVYRLYDKPEVSLDTIIQLGKALNTDMSKYFPEVLQAVQEPPVGYSAPKNYAELMDEVKFWKDKYIDVLEKYNSLLNEQLLNSESTHRSDGKGSRSA